MGPLVTNQTESSKNTNLKLLPRGICPKEASTVLEKAPWHHDTSSSRKCIARVRLQNRPVHSKVLSVKVLRPDRLGKTDVESGSVA